MSSDGNFWWEDLIGLSASRISGMIQSKGAGPANQPYLANPVPTKYKNYGPDANGVAQWLSASAAQTTPIFVRGCTQFIVEFAGDYARQDPATGQFQAAGQDGQIDFIVDQPTSDPATWTRRIRWYGFPRDVCSASKSGQDIPGAPVPDGQITQFDVVPVSWYLGVNNRQTFERSVPTNPGLPMTQMPFNTTGVNYLPVMVSPAYICAWGPDVPANLRPKLIRITIAIDEPTGRLNTEQTYEFIYALP
jgi:hypothetical protein